MRSRAEVFAAVILVVAATFLSACGDDSAKQAVEPTASASGAATAERSDAERVAAIQVCRQVITSAGVMVRDYNTFMKRLNETRSYRPIDDEDRWAVETLKTGADVVDEAVTPGVPDDLVDAVGKFVDSSKKLAGQIDDKRRQGLNKVSDEWGKERTAVLDRCSEFLPTE